MARVLGLEYPGGPKIDKLSKQGMPNIELPHTYFEDLDFSFSGIKTAVLNINHKMADLNKSDMCASFQKVATDMLIENTKRAIKKLKIQKVALAGGVSANSYIRQKFLELGENEKVEIYFPKLDLCTDNAAMIGAAGYYYYINGKTSSLDLNAVPNLKI